MKKTRALLTLISFTSSIYCACVYTIMGASGMYMMFVIFLLFTPLIIPFLGTIIEAFVVNLDGRDRDVGMIVVIVIQIIEFILFTSWLGGYPIEYANEGGGSWSYEFNQRMIVSCVFAIYLLSTIILAILYHYENAEIAKKQMFRTLKIFAPILIVFLIAGEVFTQYQENNVMAKISTNISKDNRDNEREMLNWLFANNGGIKSIELTELDGSKVQNKDMDYFGTDSDDYSDEIMISKINNKKVNNKSFFNGFTNKTVRKRLNLTNTEKSPRAKKLYQIAEKNGSTVNDMPSVKKSEKQKVHIKKVSFKKYKPLQQKYGIYN